MKHYDHEHGYVRETILVFTDPDLEEDDYSKIKAYLQSYSGDSGEVININIFKNEDGSGAIIYLVIVCFKSLIRLLEVTDLSYFYFIEKHRVAFMNFYNFM